MRLEQTRKEVRELRLDWQHEVNKREEAERRQQVDEAQLIQIAKFLGKDASTDEGVNSIAEVVENEVTKLREVLQFALDKCRCRNAGNLQNPFAYLNSRDWEEFEKNALDLLPDCIEEEVNEI